MGKAPNSVVARVYLYSVHDFREKPEQFYCSFATGDANSSRGVPVTKAVSKVTRTVASASETIKISIELCACG